MLLLAAVEASSSGGESLSLCVIISSTRKTTKKKITNYERKTGETKLTRLYNQPVYEAERVKRPFKGWSREWGPLSHSGVRVTLEDGSQWLIHKGNEYGKSSQTVVVDARHMGPRWRVRRRHWTSPGTVGDLVAVGGSRYNRFFDNCHLASRRIMRQ
uniref:Uncharacterized protein n=1 Tax=Myripristis murdjan TaxID=586833 RepID=A0A667Y7R9_9TELE